jgi:hypothetical protein
VSHLIRAEGSSTTKILQSINMHAATAHKNRPCTNCISIPIWGDIDDLCALAMVLNWQGVELVAVSYAVV